MSEDAALALHQKKLEKDFSSRLLLVNQEAELTRLTRLTSHPQILRATKNDEDSLKMALWRALFLEITAPFDRELARPILRMKEAIDAVGAGFLDLDLPRFENFIRNLCYSARMKDGRSLEGHFAGTPAIITGGGPTLRKLAPHLGEISQRALIFSGGAAVTALMREKITPDFIAALDGASSSTRNASFANCRAPLFFQISAASAILAQAKGDLLYLPESSYHFEQWLCEKAGYPSGIFDSGWTVVNFQMAIARHLGCSPIILAGVDLCGNRADLYAAKTDLSDGGWLPLSDSGFSGDAGKLLTRRDWLISKEWIEEFANSSELWRIHPSQLPIEGARIVTLADLQALPEIEKKMPQNFPHIQPLPFEIGNEIAESEECLKRLLTLIESAYPNSPLEGLPWLLAIKELEKSAVYGHFLLPIWSVWVHIFNREKKITACPLHFEVNRILFLQNTLAKLEAIWSKRAQPTHC